MQPMHVLPNKPTNYIQLEIITKQSTYWKKIIHKKVKCQCFFEWMFGVGLRLCLLQDKFSIQQTFGTNLKFLSKPQRKRIILGYIWITNYCNSQWTVKIKFLPFSRSLFFSHLSTWIIFAHSKLSYSCSLTQSSALLHCYSVLHCTVTVS